MHTATRTHRHHKLHKHNQTTQTRQFTIIRPILSDFHKIYYFFATTYERARTHTHMHTQIGNGNGVVYLHHKLNYVSNTRPNHCNAFILDVIVRKI